MSSIPFPLIADPSKFYFPTGESTDFDPRKQQKGPESWSYPGIRVAFGGFASLSCPSQLYPLRLDATLVPCIGPQLVGSIWASWPHLILFPAQGRPRSWPVILHCSSPEQQVLLGDVIVRLCMAVDQVLCWHGHVFSCLGDICPLGCHNSSFFAVALWEARHHPGPQRSGSAVPVRHTVEAVLRSHWALFSVTPHCVKSVISPRDSILQGALPPFLHSVFYSILRTADFICMDR